jgi:hydrogenase expression/formation protein HypE
MPQRALPPRGPKTITGDDQNTMAPKEMTGDSLAATRPVARTGTEQALIGLIEPEDVDVGSGEVVVSTDSCVVTPRVFPGGDIGELAVNGIVNDLATRGACPVAICLAYILEEGLGVDELHAVTASAARTARAAGVRIVAGDTTVVGPGAADGLFVTTTGIGVRLPEARVSAANARPDDVVLISGPIGLHGTAVLGAREGLAVEVASDTRPLYGLVAAMVEAGREHVHALRGPARGGLASALTEVAHASAVGVEVNEAAIPVPGPVAASCERLGLDPLHVANAGCLVAFVAPEAALDVLVAMRAHPAGTQARPIGRAVAAHHGLVRMYTMAGETRLVDPPGEQVPRV